MRATSAMNTGLSPWTPTTSLATSAAVSMKVPVWTSISRLPVTRLPAGCEALETCSAALRSCAVTPLAFMRSASMRTRITWPGPPTVTTSRVPGMRLNSISAARATFSSSKAPLSGSAVWKVRVTMGTSSMPLGLMIGSPTPRFGETQSRHRVHVLDARDARQDLLGRPGHEGLDVPGRGAGKGNEDIGHGHVDLRLLLARRDQRRKDAQQQGDQCQQRGHRVAQEESGDASGNAHDVCRVVKIKDAKLREGNPSRLGVPRFAAEPYLLFSFMMPRALMTIFSNTGSVVPFFILRMKYFSKATLARWTHLPSENQFTLRGGICGRATKAAPVSPKSARQTAFQVARSSGSRPSSWLRMLCAVAATIDSIM